MGSKQTKTVISEPKYLTDDQFMYELERGIVNKYQEIESLFPDEPVTAFCFSGDLIVEYFIRNTNENYNGISTKKLINILNKFNRPYTLEHIPASKIYVKFVMNV